ncbi:Phthiodiolone/phenolphthiodiolone dimycocerosates ketoreductase [Nocardia otitidiscaviarum]|uniref:Phthiodiolone/phenolphthiodiolone dimycocerosates ketoreductase n=1 Tax=Nocardia otitidiscaviarum TaxID=1823 RepID=A0A379JJY0_9NOCA|nr:LLM class flavin-dependent oxidoreductase [Nocardia otitidiscaviarum]SUD48892.1 Phthiodiolone/phenolphthiodiolone dimycocerosates ketoreductase [Nocardia otitidiscaviarum]
MSDARKSFAVGTLAGINPPLGAARFVVRMARLGRLDSVLATDHLISVFPRAAWDADFTPQAKSVRSPDEQFDFAPLLAHLAASAGRVQPEAIVPAAMITMLTARTPAGLRRILRAPAVRYLGLFAPAAVWTRCGAKHPFGPDFRGLIDLMPHHLTATDVREAIAEVPEEVLHEWLVIGTPGDILNRLRALADAGLRHAIVFPSSALVSAADAAFGYGVVLWLAAQLRRGAGSRPTG